MPHLVVPHLRSDATGQPQPADVILALAACAAECIERLLEHGCARSGTLGEASGERIEQQIVGARRRRCRGRGACRLRHVELVALAPEATSEDGRAERFEIGVARQSLVEGLEQLRGPEQQGRRIVATPERKGDLSAEASESCALKCVQGTRLSHGEDLARGIGGAGVELGLRRVQRTGAATGCVRRQLGRAFEKRGCRRGATAAAGSISGTMQLSGDGLVRPRRGLRAVPRAAIGIDIRIGHLCQRPMYCPTLARLAARYAADRTSG